MGVEVRPLCRSSMAQRRFNRHIGPTNLGDRHAMSQPEAKWTPTSGSATVIGQTEMLIA